MIEADARSTRGRHQCGWACVGAAAAMLFIGTASAGGPKPGRCQYPESDKPWPVVLDPDGGPPAAVTESEARRAVAAFRRAWRRDVLPHAGPIAAALAHCMESDRGYYIRRASGASAAHRVAALQKKSDGHGILRGDPARLSEHDWVWDIYFGGSVDTLRPTGSMGGFLAPDGRLLVAVQWPEG